MYEVTATARRVARSDNQPAARTAAGDVTNEPLDWGGGHHMNIGTTSAGPSWATRVLRCAERAEQVQGELFVLGAVPFEKGS